MKKKQFEEFIIGLGKCEKCKNLKCSKKSLINVYEHYNFGVNIPSIWTDWFNRLNSKVMVIGQDWGPYKDMKKLNKLVKKIKVIGKN